ncbi:VOC family protein [Mucilaginibacter terrenus]|uniref:VOC family protein n=1 Tax=Mucilaginibacter terrenus TaxID=2482727 RepID=A0A3E2NRJ2_9SPHI|nr:VOC family protein [Mucilaginibacter terrenus]RFZ83500.1 VOC family protein [Mucilaginibacter terrenus]
MQKISTFLWFNGNGQEALDLYVSIFKNAEIKQVSKHGGQLFSATIELEGTEFMILNWQGEYQFSPAISLFVKCRDQEEVDEIWNKMLDNEAKPMQCGWITDKFGVSWQIIPDALGRLMNDPDPAKAQRVMQAMMKMVKIDVAGLEEAYNNG